MSVKLNCESYLAHVDHIKGVVRKLGTSLDVIDDKINVLRVVLYPIPALHCGLLETG
jgi:hypothetical protein